MERKDCCGMRYVSSACGATAIPKKEVIEPKKEVKCKSANTNNNNVGVCTGCPAGTMKSTKTEEKVALKKEEDVVKVKVGCGGFGSAC